MASAGCGPRPDSSEKRPKDPETVPAESSSRVDLFTDITSSAGISFRHYNDASPRRLLPETMGAGVAVFDYDGDGRPDLFFVNGAPLAGSRAGAPTAALYRSSGNGRFEDVTRIAGVADPFYGMGAAVGDIDNDGDLDLFVSGVGEDRLYRNRGDGTFEDATEEMGLVDSGFGSSAAFFDYDRDGFLDLFVGRYVQWSPQSDIPCIPDGVNRTYCTPEAYPGQSNRLYRNVRGGRFEDVTARSGIRRPEGKTLGVAVLDHNRDGWPDLAVANDTVRNFLFVNNRDGTFTEAGVMTGMAYSESGATRGGMGIDAADADNDGFVDIAIGNFSKEMAAFYRGSERGFFVDDAAPAGIGLPTLMTLAFGLLFTDFDSDGRLDLVVVNGHIEPEIAKTQKMQSHAQLPQFFRNVDRGEFVLLGPRTGSPLSVPLVARGLASGDLDEDGDLDLIITQNGDRAVLLRNDAPARSWIRIRLEGTSSNRSGYGAVVKAVSGERSWTRSLVSGRSYLSASEPILTLGLGDVSKLDRLEIIWPSGTTQTVQNPPLNETLTLTEPKPR
jgi:hypothetical protein